MLFSKFLKTKGKGHGTWYAQQKTYLENKMQLLSLNAQEQTMAVQ